MCGSIHNERLCCGKWPESRTGTQALRATHQFTVSRVGRWVEVMPSAPSWLRDLVGAWIFYSVLPAWPWPQPRFERIARFAPWVGLVIGGLQAGLWWLLSSFGWPQVALVPAVLALGFLNAIRGFSVSVSGVPASSCRGNIHSKIPSESSSLAGLRS